MKKEKFIFLDIDGVLNHELWLEHAHKQNFPSPLFWFDPLCVERVNEIIKQTGAKLVISSSWRSDPDLKETFARVQLPTDFDKTIGMFQSSKIGYTMRGQEIEHYLREHGIDIYAKHQYVILDDDNDFTPWQKKNALFRTAASICDEPFERNNGTGLTRELTQKIIKYLNEKS